MRAAARPAVFGIDDDIDIAIGHSWGHDCFALNMDHGTEHMVPYRCGNAEVSAFRRVMMAHVPGAKLIEIRHRGAAGMMVDEVMYDSVPPIAQHHSDRQAIREGEP
jgi:hypothetical protein